MPLLAVASSTRATAVRPPRASAAPAPAASEAAGRRPVKVILPKKPQKWSTGMAPGEYGGGPSTIMPRSKYWWGKEDRDPVGNTDDFIWNKDFLPHVERVGGGAGTEPTITRLTPVDEEEAGFLSINRAMSLDRNAHLRLSMFLMTHGEMDVAIAVWIGGDCDPQVSARKGL